MDNDNDNRMIMDHGDGARVVMVPVVVVPAKGGIGASADGVLAFPCTEFRRSQAFKCMSEALDHVKVVRREDQRARSSWRSNEEVSEFKSQSKLSGDRFMFVKTLLKD